MNEKQTNKNNHTELKQQAHLIVGTIQAFKKNEFVEGKDTQNDSFNGGINGIKPECPSFVSNKGLHQRQYFDAPCFTSLILKKRFICFARTFVMLLAS
jgi:hypothetical protein